MPVPFKYRLQTVLNLRIRQRNQRAAELAEVHRSEQAVREQIVQLQDAAHRCRQHARRLQQSARLDVARLKQAQNHLGGLRESLSAASGQRERLNREMEQRRQALVEADREVRVLEKLRDKQQRQFMEARQRIEQMRIDEIAGIQFMQNREESA